MIHAYTRSRTSAHAYRSVLPYAPVHNIGDLRFLRLFTVVLIALIALGIYRSFIYAGWNFKWAACMSLIIATLPSFQVDASWALTASYPLAAVTAGAAFYFAESSFHTPAAVTRRKYIAGAVLLMLLSVTNFQPGVMFFWTFAVIVMFRPSETVIEITTRVIRYGLITLAALVPGYAVFRLGLAAYGEIIPSERTRIAMNVTGKIEWFITNPLRDSLNLLWIFRSDRVAAASGIFIFGGLILYFGITRRGLFKMAAALAILPLSYLPNLVTAENWSSYRTQLALSSIVAVYAFLAIQGFCRGLPARVSQAVISALLLLCAVMGVLLAAYHVDRYFAVPQMAELHMVQSQLAPALKMHPPEIEAVGCTWHDSIAPPVLYDEFGLPSCAQPWIPGPEVYLVLREMLPRSSAMPLVRGPLDGRETRSTPAFVVDMRKLKSLRR